MDKTKIKCPFCSHEMPPDQAFCGNCGKPLNADAQLTTQKTISKEEEKHPLKKIILPVSLIALVLCSIAAFLVVFFQPIHVLSRAIDHSNFEEAAKIYATNSYDTKFVDSVIKLAHKKEKHNTTAFAKGSITYESAINFIDSVNSACKTELSDEVLAEINKSKNAFANALDAESNLKFKEAIENYILVSPSDIENYDTAVKSISRCTTLYSNEIVGQANEQLQNKKYDDAIKTLSSAIAFGYITEDVTALHDRAVTERKDFICSTALDKAKTLSDPIAAYKVIAEVDKNDYNPSFADDIAPFYTNAYNTVKSKLETYKASKAYDEALTFAKTLPTDLLSTELKNIVSSIKVERTNALITAIGTVTLQSEKTINTAMAAYDSLSADEKKNTFSEVLFDARDTYQAIKEKAELDAFNDAVSRTRTNYDRVKNRTWYEAKSQPVYIDTRSYVFPYIAVTGNTRISADSSARLCLKINYTGKDWIFYDTIIFWIDGDTTVKYYDYFEINHDNSGGHVWEVVNTMCTDSYIELLNKIVNSKETIVRFVGDNNYAEFTVSQADKNGIKDILLIFDYITNH